VTRLAKLQATLVASITEPDARALASPARDAWLGRHKLEPADAEALARVDDLSFSLYRSLVRKTLDSAIRVELPRTARLLGPRFDASVATFLESLPRSHYLRDVAFELVQAMGPVWDADPSVPRFAHELARHELSLFEVGSGVGASPPPEGAAADAALDLERPVRLAGNPRVYRYGHPVHELADGATELPARETALLAYRDAEHEVRYLALSPLAADLGDRLIAGQALGSAITEAARDRGVALDPEVLGSIAALLADFAARGIVVGTATDPGS
jgi:hypothetical protein